ncbi:S-adenosyl-L-methionine-dependent methyltransferase [Xylona heveae TC161]|uniref:S-adenosyl-L-methionine-dependent methyltransferase n=1 Tax=Xylona heveae (strain CBS 132557 / TC161) TaxID=1328760 RepID=A0A165ITF5_XYLHT|nr:S-adenosyl-L-methionine-dependent methyltransferase [Xylona heveae TC161]KZF25363.1 S-adenosyl-L-methionine-dependent methyltransferase [Xylona heveae TC161]
MSAPERGTEDPEAETKSLDSEYLKTVTIHNRVFQQHSIENGIYLAPVDEDEVERLNLQHNVLNSTFDGRLIFPPVQKPRRILDCGYGSGSWASEVAEQHPDCEVTGIDISPQMRPDDTPENLWLQLDDLNQPFTFRTNTFDLIHSRLVANGIYKNRWPTYLRDIVRALKPGGWLQMVEIYYQCQSDNGSLTEHHALRQWSTKYLAAHETTKDLRVPLRLNALMHHAGLVEVESRMIPWPLCGWSKDPRERTIGEMNRENIDGMLSSIALFSFTSKLRMSEAEASTLIERARKEAKDPSLKAYFPLYVCIGRKPNS